MCCVSATHDNLDLAFRPGVRPKYAAAQVVVKRMARRSSFLTSARCMKVRKKFWLLPIIFVMLLVGTLLVFADGSALAPFIYTIF